MQEYYFELSLRLKCEFAFSDISRQENSGVHLPHRVLRVHRGRAVGRSDHLQDPAQLHRAPGHAQLGPELRPALRDRAGRLPVLHARHGQGTPHVPPEVS